MIRKLLYSVTAFVSLGYPANASETATFTYDALGRLDTVSHSGGPASGVSSDYNYDAAGNRTQVVVTGAMAMLDEGRVQIAIRGHARHSGRGTLR